MNLGRPAMTAKSIVGLRKAQFPTLTLSCVRLSNQAHAEVGFERRSFVRDRSLSGE